MAKKIIIKWVLVLALISVALFIVTQALKQPELPPVQIDYLAQYEHEYNQCVDNQWELYSAQWDLACTRAGLYIDCDLPEQTAKYLNEQYEKGANTCFDLLEVKTKLLDTLR